MSAITCKEGQSILEPPKGIEPYTAEEQLVRNALEELCARHCKRGSCAAIGWAAGVMGRAVLDRASDIGNNARRQFEPVEVGE